MRIAGRCIAVGGRNEGGSTSCGCGGDAVSRGGKGAVAVVGMKLDSGSKELLTWALVKIARPGDSVIALHISNPSSDKSEMQSLMKTLDSLVAAYEGFCNLKQVNLEFKVCRGSPARTVLVSEANVFNAPNLVVGTSSTHHNIRSSLSVAKYCGRKARKSISVIAVKNGKVVYHREATASIGQGSHIFNLLEMSSKSKTLAKSPNAPDPEDKSFKQLPLSSSGNVDTSALLPIVPFKTTDVRQSSPGSALFRKVFHQNLKSVKHSAKAPYVLQWNKKVQYEQSFGHLDRKQNRYNELCHSSNSDVVEASNESTTFRIPKEVECLTEKYSTICRLFRYQELLIATSGFLHENIIGNGGSSKVYKGCLPDGVEVAVKIFNPSEIVVKQFCSELEIITSLHHKHIISLLGYCVEENNLLLVYDLLSRGSLEDNLHGIHYLQTLVFLVLDELKLPWGIILLNKSYLELGPQNGGNSFGWDDRFKVALGVAEALDHLHNSAMGPIIHRDVKSSNILLSDDFEPKLSDFGLATSASVSCDLDDTDIVGTFGYMAPEYFMNGKVNEKIDVYALGVVLLELLSGRKPIDNTNSNQQESLVIWAKQTLRDGKATDLLDSSLLETYKHEEFERLVLAATLCIKRAPSRRPPIDIVVKLLHGEGEAIDWAMQEANSSGEVDAEDDEQHPPPANIHSFINIALQNLDSESLSCCVSNQNISVEDYLRGRYSGSSSFN